MKKGMVFLLGFLAGVVVTVVAIYILGSSVDGVRNDPITWYEEPYEMVTFHKGVDVFQMLQEDCGLANPTSYEDGTLDIYLVFGDKIYDGKHIAQNRFNVVGVYTYTDRQKRVRNVPVLKPVK